MAKQEPERSAPSGATLRTTAKPAPIVLHACSRALAVSTEQNSRAGDIPALFPPTTDEREVILEAFRAALYSDILSEARP